MDSIFVISEEPALAETLASELPGVTVMPARAREAAARLKEGEWLVIADEGASLDNLTENMRNSAILLKRPVRLAELLYTIRERLQGKSERGREEFPLKGDLRFCPSERLIRQQNADAAIALTEKETELLQCLLEAEGSTVARDILLKRVWGYSDDIATHTLETHIYRLRGKLRQASEALDILSSDEGGYQLQL